MILVFTLCFLIFISAFLSGSETSLFSLSPMTLKFYERSENPKRRALAELMSRPREVLVTLLMVNILVNILVQNTVANLFDWGGWGLKVGLPLFLTLILGEVIPKTIAFAKNVEMAPLVAPIVGALSSLLSPVRRPLTKLTHWISRFFVLFLRREDEVSREELRHILQESEEYGVLLPSECNLISGSFDLKDSLVKEKMRPRDEVVYFNINDSLETLLSLFIDQEVSRVPIIENDIEKLLGILQAKDFFFAKEGIHETKDVLPLLRKPEYVPESMNAWALLKLLREKGERLAIVVSEYGSISGIVTQEDLIETVVGEIQDLRDASSLYTRASDDVIIASGKLELSEFKTIFGIPLTSKENIVTLAGWLVEQMEDIPTIGMKYVTDSFLFYVLAAEPNRVKRIYVRCLAKDRTKEKQKK